jgi:hypothetical protein
VVSKCDRNGNIAWQTNAGGGTAYAVTQTRNGTYILCGTRGIEAINEPVYALHLAADGRILWEKVYTSHPVYRLDKCSVIQSQNGNFVLAVQAFLLEIDASGSIVWSRDTKSFLAASLSQFSDGTFAIGGSLLLGGIEHAYVAAVDRLGQRILWDNVDLSTNSSIAQLLVDDHGNVAAGGNWPAMGAHDGMFLTIFKRVEMI